MSSTNDSLKAIAKATTALVRPYADTTAVLKVLVLHNIGRVIDSYQMQASLYSAREALIGDGRKPVLFLPPEVVAIVRGQLEPAVTIELERDIPNRTIALVWEILAREELREAFNTLGIGMRYGSGDNEDSGAVYLFSAEEPPQL